jgi:hypothetical protein
MWICDDVLRQEVERSHVSESRGFIPSLFGIGRKSQIREAAQSIH